MAGWKIWRILPSSTNDEDLQNERVRGPSLRIVSSSQMRSRAQTQLVATATLILRQITGAWVGSAVFLLVTLSVQAQSQFILRNKNIEAFGVPAVRLREENRDYRLYATIRFVKEFLIK